MRPRRGRGRALSVGMGIVLLAGPSCSWDGSIEERGGGRRPPATPTVSNAPAPGRPPPVSRPSREPITIAVAGDIHFEGVLRERLDDPATALSPAGTTLAAADVAIANLETSVGTGGRPEPGKRYTFTAPGTAFTALAAAGIDVIAMANNHALDFGRAVLPATFDALDATQASFPALAVVGLGRDVRAAFRPARLAVGDTSVAVVAATVADADPTADPTGTWAATPRLPGTADAMDPTRLLRAVRGASRSADVVVAYLHWGVQGQRCPSGSQRSLARRIVRAGGDLVVGSHTHRLQGDGRLEDGYVAYGLGNYAWYTQESGAVPETGVLTLTVRPAATRRGSARVTRAEWEPARIGADGLPAPVRTGPALSRFEADRAALRRCAGLTA